MKHDTTLSTQPHPIFFVLFFTHIYCYFFDQVSKLYILYNFPVEIQTVLAPVYFFFTHKNTKKSHYKDTQLLWIY